VGCLFDQFVGAAAQRQGHVDAQEIGRLHVDEQLDFGCLQHRQVSGLLHLENAPGIDASQPPMVDAVLP